MKLCIRFITSASHKIQFSFSSYRFSIAFLFVMTDLANMDGKSSHRKLTINEHRQEKVKDNERKNREN